MALTSSLSVTISVGIIQRKILEIEGKIRTKQTRYCDIETGASLNSLVSKYGQQRINQDPRTVKFADTTFIYKISLPKIIVLSDSKWQMERIIRSLVYIKHDVLMTVVDRTSESPSHLASAKKNDVNGENKEQFLPIPAQYHFATSSTNVPFITTDTMALDGNRLTLFQDFIKDPSCMQNIRSQPSINSSPERSVTTMSNSPPPNKPLPLRQYTTEVMFQSISRSRCRGQVPYGSTISKVPQR